MNAITCKAEQVTGRRFLDLARERLQRQERLKEDSDKAELGRRERESPSNRASPLGLIS